MKLTDFNHETVSELVEFTKDRLNELKDYASIHGCDLHNEIFNTDYYIIGTYKAEQWLLKDGIFYVIETIREYEQDNFGEVNTDFSNAENVVNMFVYILGELILQESEILSDNWDSILESEQYDQIIEELEEL